MSGPDDGLVLQWANKNFALNNARLKIGRTAINDVRCDDPLVSSQHCSITNGIFVDTKSTNGSSINDVKAVYKQKYTLKPGDKLVIGTQVMYIKRASEVSFLGLVTDGDTTEIPAAPATPKVGKGYLKNSTHTFSVTDIVAATADEEGMDTVGKEELTTQANTLKLKVNTTLKKKEAKIWIKSDIEKELDKSANLLPLTSSEPNFLNSTHNFSKRQKRALRKKRNDRGLQAGVDKNFLDEYLERVESLESTIEGLTYQLLYVGRDEREWIKRIEKEAVRAYKEEHGVPSLADIQNSLKSALVLNDKLKTQLERARQQEKSAMVVPIKVAESDEEDEEGESETVIVDADKKEEVQTTTAANHEATLRALEESTTENKRLQEELAKLQLAVDDKEEAYSLLVIERDDAIRIQKQAEASRLHTVKSRETIESKRSQLANSLYDLEQQFALQAKTHEDQLAELNSHVADVTGRRSTLRNTLMLDYKTKMELAEQKNEDAMRVLRADLSMELGKLHVQLSEHQIELREKEIEVKNLRDALLEQKQLRKKEVALVLESSELPVISTSRKNSTSMGGGMHPPVVIPTVKLEQQQSPYSAGQSNGNVVVAKGKVDEGVADSGSWGKTFLQQKIHALEAKYDELHRSNRMTVLELQRRVHEVEVLRGSGAGLDQKGHRYHMDVAANREHKHHGVSSGGGGVETSGSGSRVNSARRSHKPEVYQPPPVTSIYVNANIPAHHRKQDAWSIGSQNAVPGRPRVAKLQSYINSYGNSDNKDRVINTHNTRGSRPPADIGLVNNATHGIASLIYAGEREDNSNKSKRAGGGNRSRYINTNNAPRSRYTSQPDARARIGGVSKRLKNRPINTRHKKGKNNSQDMFQPVKLKLGFPGKLGVKIRPLRRE